MKFFIQNQRIFVSLLRYKLGNKFFVLPNSYMIKNKTFIQR